MTEVEFINKLIDEGNIIKEKYIDRSNSYSGPQVKLYKLIGWLTKVRSTLSNSENNLKEFLIEIDRLGNETSLDWFNIRLEILENAKDYLSNAPALNLKYEQLLEIIFNKFHIISKQLLNRHNSRGTIKINDEYDVQDLLHALLKMFFNDIRAEEYTPSYAGSSTRMDILLKNEQFVIETKMTRKGLEDKELGKQIILDIVHYKTHPNCKKLYCLIYDPNSLILNRTGLINDLEKNNNDFVKIIIKP